MNEMTLVAEFDLTSSLDPEETYNPLEFIEGEDDEDWMDDDNLLLPNVVPPESVQPKKQAPVFSPERTGSVTQAMRDLVTTNAARRHILLSIIDEAREGVPASILFSKIADVQKDNLSVYEPVSFCRMLERAGALSMVIPESTSESTLEGKLDSGSGEESIQAIEYLTIEENIDPLWQSTEEGLTAYEDLMKGSEWREVVLGSDSIYAEVYLAVMNALLEGKPQNEIIDLAETFEVTKDPRKFGAYFIDVLEATATIRWSNRTWNLTDLGRKLLPELVDRCEQNQLTESPAE